MKTRRPFYLLAASSLLLWGCAPGVWQTEQTVSPMSYQASFGHIPRNVGKLRRPDVLGIYSQPPKICAPNSDARIMALNPTIMLDYLKTHKGYELSELDATRYQAWISNAYNQEFLKELVEWSANTAKDAPLGPLGTALLEQIKASEKVDGLLLIHIQDSCLLAIPEHRAALALMTLGMNELLPSRDSTELHSICRAAILETTSSKVVWRNSLGMDMSHIRHFSCQKDNENHMDVLFKDLEPAIPKLLTR